MNYVIYSIPRLDHEHFRKKLNSTSRRDAQFEVGKMGRGPYEHQRLHHVLGADLLEDQCYKYASKFGFFRISKSQTVMKCHKFQRYLIYQIFIELFFETLTQLTSGIATRIDSIKVYWLYHDYVSLTASLIGIISTAALARTILLLPCSSIYGAASFFGIHMLKYFFYMHQAGLIFAQHKWDEEVDPREVNQNWGKYNALTSFSLIGENFKWHPFLWLQFGSCPSTLTYHAEHTLFPGVNYLYLPMISVVLEKLCIAHGIRYNKLNSLTELDHQYRRMLHAYSK
jgi:hypothetical protein